MPVKLRDMQILSAAYLAFALLPPSGYSLCVVYNATGEPCPGCGMTRALHLLLLGEMTDALRHHAVSVVLLPVLLFFVGTIFWRRGGSWYEAHRSLVGRGLLLGAGLLAVYGLVRVLSLEGVIPLSRLFAPFHEPVLIRRIWPVFFH